MPEPDDSPVEDPPEVSGSDRDAADVAQSLRDMGYGNGAFRPRTFGK